jgi:hypothetical protein
MPGSRCNLLTTAADDCATASIYTIESGTPGDVLLCASAMDPPSRIDEAKEVERTYPRQARTPFNITGHPALAMMAGISSSGLPLSVQFVGRNFAEATLLRRPYFRSRANGNVQPVPTKSILLLYPPGNGCIRRREGPGHAFCRHDVRRPCNKRRSDCHNVRVRADHNSKVRVPGGSALGSGRLRERQVGPWPLPGATAAIKAINASAPACSSPVPTWPTPTVVLPPSRPLSCAGAAAF